MGSTSQTTNLRHTPEKISLLFVCLGNICRSPAAEGIMQHLVDEAGLTNRFIIDSAGIGGWHVGDLPDKRMRRCGKTFGYDFCSRARQIQADDFKHFDYIIVMDSDNYLLNMFLDISREDIRATAKKRPKFEIIDGGDDESEGQEKN